MTKTGGGAARVKAHQTAGRLKDSDAVRFQVKHTGAHNVPLLAWLDIVKNLTHHPRTETVPLPSGCLFVPQQYTRLQRSFLDLVEAARHLRQAARCLWWSWLGVRAPVRD